MGGKKRSKRYKKTEEKILAVFFAEPQCPMWKLAKKAGIARSTFYTHHHSARLIIPDYEKDILERYSKSIKKKLQKDVGLKNLYLDTLLFIVKNRQIFGIFLEFGNREIIIKMLSILRLKIEIPDKLFRIYIAEVTEIIFEWGERGLLEGEIEEVLCDIKKLRKVESAVF